MSSAPASPPATWEIWFDGAAFPNPGRMGLGALILGPNGERYECSLAHPEPGCNNEAEVRALLHALERIRQAGASHAPILARGDSDFAIRHLRDALETRVPHLQTLLTTTRQTLTYFPALQLAWVPRHRNSAADKLSRGALGLVDKPAEVPRGKKRRRGRR